MGDFGRERQCIVRREKLQFGWRGFGVRRGEEVAVLNKKAKTVGNIVGVQVIGFQRLCDEVVGGRGRGGGGIGTCHGLGPGDRGARRRIDGRIGGAGRVRDVRDANA